jgi:PAS domain S-box-containing protein
MIYLDLVFNLALLVAISVVSGFIEKHFPGRNISGKASQGVLFGIATIVGMMRPLQFEPGLIFDGRSMMISLCSLFFGPVAGIIAAVPAMGYRVYLGGFGTLTGVFVILSSLIIGLIGHYRMRPDERPPEAKILFLFGMIVHLVMLAMMLTLPRQAAIQVLKTLSLPILLLYPLATILVGKILSDQIVALRSREALLESESLFRSLFENHSAVKMIIEPETGAIVDANKSAENYYGWSRENIRQMKIYQINTLEPDAIRQQMALALNNEKTLFYFKHRLANGTIRDVEVYSSKIEVKGEPLLYSIIHDVTERKQIEERLRQSQKLETVGRLAGGIAHDFNNILTVVMGYAEMAICELSSNDPLRRFLDEILKAARRSADLIEQLLAFARKQAISPRQLELNVCVENMLKMLRHLIGEDIALNWISCREPLQVKIDPTQLEQVLINLCVNARDAINGTGKITIETGKFSAKESFCKSNEGFRPGDYLTLSITDDGCGIEEDMLKNIFEPFFTTKSLHKGTGLGLATVLGIVQQNEGVIQVQSRVGVGTTFKVFLPEDKSEIKTPEVQEFENCQPEYDKMILMVEDEPAILKMGVQMLETLGYKVLAASSPTLALDMLEKDDLEIGLLLTDVIMPEMNGRELAEKVKQKIPDVRVLYMSGYTADVIANRGIIDADVNFIAKPFSLQKLGVAIRKVLEAKADKS